MEQQIWTRRFSPEATKVIEGLLAAGDSPHDGVGMHTMNEYMQSLDGELPHVLEEVMRRGGAASRLLASVMATASFAEFPKQAEKHPGVVALAEQVISEQLADSDAAKVGEVCNFLAWCGAIPISVIPRLEELARSRNYLIAAMAIVALSWAEGYEKYTPKLLRLVQSEDPVEVMIAAPALLRRRLQLPLVTSRLISVLPNVPWNEQYGMVRPIAEAGPAAIRLLPILNRLATNDEIPPHFRGQVAAAIGSVTRGSDADVAILRAMLREGHSQVIGGAIEGMLLNGNIGPNDIAYLADELMSHPDDQVRTAAIHAIKETGRSGRPALPRLIERMRFESDLTIGRALAECIATIAEDAIPLLIDEIRRLDTRTMLLATHTLRKIGTKAIVPVVGQLLNDPSPDCQFFGVSVLKDVGIHSVGVVPLLEQALRSTCFPEVGRAIIDVLTQLGPNAIEACGAVIEVIMQVDDPNVTTACIEALRRMGPDTVLLVKELAAATDFPAEMTSRLRAALKRMDTGPQPVRSDLERLNCDELLRYFVIVAEVMRDNPTWGTRQIATELAERPEYELFSSLNLGVKHRSILRRLAEIEKVANRGTLTDGRSPQPKRLTEAGKLFLKEVKSYVESKYGHDKTR